MRSSLRHVGVVAAAMILHAGCGDTNDGRDLEPLFEGDDSLIGSELELAISTADSEKVVVTVPAGGASLGVVVSGLGTVSAQPATIIDPNGEKVFEVGEYVVNRLDAYPGVVTALVPLNPKVEVIPGEWEFVFFGNGGAPQAQLRTFVRVDPSPATGTLDLNLHFVGLEDIDASTAPDDADFQAILDGVAAVYSGAGISFGDVQHFDVDDDQYAVLSTSANGSDELLAMLARYSDDRDNRALNLFFVADIEDPTSSASLLGVSGGIPGPPAIHGTQRSGVAVNMASYLAALETGEGMAQAQAEVELIAAHEIGHYLGLYHTTEANGAALSGGLNGADPLDDTPVCEDAADADANGILSSSECDGAGGNNLMFWSPPNGASGLSANQKHVLQRNPVVR